MFDWVETGAQRSGDGGSGGRKNGGDGFFEIAAEKSIWGYRAFENISAHAIKKDDDDVFGVINFEIFVNKIESVVLDW